MIRMPDQTSVFVHWTSQLRCPGQLAERKGFPRGKVRGYGSVQNSVSTGPEPVSGQRVQPVSDVTDLFTASMPFENDRYKCQIYKPLRLFVFFLAPTCERIFIKPYTIESRSAIGPETTLLAAACLHLSARKFYTLRQRRG